MPGKVVVTDEEWNAAEGKTETPHNDSGEGEPGDCLDEGFEEANAMVRQLAREERSSRG